MSHKQAVLALALFGAVSYVAGRLLWAAWWKGTRP